MESEEEAVEEREAMRSSGRRESLIHTCYQRGGGGGGVWRRESDSEVKGVDWGNNTVGINSMRE